MELWWGKNLVLLNNDSMQVNAKHDDEVRMYITD